MDNRAILRTTLVKSVMPKRRDHSDQLVICQKLIKIVESNTDAAMEVLNMPKATNSVPKEPIRK